MLLNCRNSMVAAPGQSHPPRCGDGGLVQEPCGATGMRVSWTLSARRGCVERARLATAHHAVGRGTQPLPSLQARHLHAFHVCGHFLRKASMLTTLGPA